MGVNIAIGHSFSPFILGVGFVELTQRPVPATFCHAHGPDTALAFEARLWRDMEMKESSHWRMCVVAGGVSSGTSSRHTLLFSLWTDGCTDTLICQGTGVQRLNSPSFAPPAPLLLITQH